MPQRRQYAYRRRECQMVHLSRLDWRRRLFLPPLWRRHRADLCADCGGRFALPLPPSAQRVRPQRRHLSPAVRTAFRHVCRPSRRARPGSPHAPALPHRHAQRLVRRDRQRAALFLVHPLHPLAGHPRPRQGTASNVRPQRRAGRGHAMLRLFRLEWRRRV